MKGAIIGDIVGSIYEFHNIKTKDFPLFSEKCSFTDDTVMTVAVAKGLLSATGLNADLADSIASYMQDYGNRYPNRGYGGRFTDWLSSSHPRPYNSWGNGAPMRCSSAGWLASSPEKAFQLGMYTAAPTHNHPESMKAAGLTAMLICHARNGATKAELRQIAEKWYSLPMLDEIRDEYSFDVSCMGTMPVALSAFFESESFEDAIRNAISIGGDSDTIAAITGSIAEAYYGVPEDLWQEASGFLDDELRLDVEEFYSFLEKAPNALENTHLTIEELSILPRKERHAYVRKFRKEIPSRRLRDFLEKEDSNSQRDDDQDLRIEVYRLIPTEKNTANLPENQSSDQQS